MTKEILLCLVLSATCAAMGIDSANAIAQEDDPAPELKFVGGAGGITCDRFTGSTTKNNAAQMLLITQWVQGFRVAYDLRGNFGKQTKRTTEGNVSEYSDDAVIARFL